MEADGPIDTCTVGVVVIPVDEITYTVGESWPIVAGSEGGSFRYGWDNSVDSNGDTIDVNPTELNSFEPLPQYWQYDIQPAETQWYSEHAQYTTRDPATKRLVLALKHSNMFPGVADIDAGSKVKAKISWSPAGSPTVVWSQEYELQWENEFYGGANGTLPTLGSSN